MHHNIMKYNGNYEICCKYGKENYGTIYFEDEGKIGDKCRICGRALKE